MNMTNGSFWFGNRPGNGGLVINKADIIKKKIDRNRNRNDERKQLVACRADECKASLPSLSVCKCVGH